jgi:uncharacterized membrane protein (DUF4010 family)
MPDLQDFQNLAIAVAIGFLIGFQREWRDAEDRKLQSFAGARTFAFVALLGGLAGLVDEGALVIAVGLAGVAALTVAAYWAEARGEPGTGGTTEVAILATYLLGVLATRGEPTLAAVGGVGAVILLSLKPWVERWAKSIDKKEIDAAIRFLAISVIILPILPDEGYGPYGALNPRSIWMMVIFISGLSFLGYWLTKLYGAHGVLLTGIVGGLASSTATTVSLSRLVKEGSTHPRAAAAGIVAANVVMLARVGILLAVTSTTVLFATWPALAAGALVGLVAAFLFWRGEREAQAEMKLGNPMELKPALFFAALLAVIAVVSRYASDKFGDSGLFAVAFLTGLADVDALTLTAGQEAVSGEISPESAGAAVLIAVASNILVKAGMTFSIAGRATGLFVGAAFAIIVAAGVGGFLLVSVVR